MRSVPGLAGCDEANDDDTAPPGHEVAVPRRPLAVGADLHVRTLAADGGTHGEAADGDDGMLVRIRQSVRPVALRCDSFSDQEEVVVKPLEGPLSGIPGIGGTAILGDGNIVPILDVVSLDG